MTGVLRPWVGAATRVTLAGMKADNSTRREIVVGIDASDGARRALAWAADEAELMNQQLRVVHVGDTLSVPGTVYPESFGHELLADALVTLARTHPEITRHTSLLIGHPVAQLRRLSGGAELLVLGRNRHGPLVTALGTITDAVLAHSRCPTAIVPADSACTGESVLVGVSGSSGGLAAFRFAMGEARRRGLPVTAVRAWSARLLRRASGAAAPIPSSDDHEVLDYAVDRMHAEFPEVEIRTALSSQSPDISLAQHARRASLLVVGSRRADDAAAYRLGPIASWAARHAVCPVLIVGHGASYGLRTDDQD